MPFKPNDKNINRNGRTKGTPNKTTSQLRETIELIQTKNLHFILEHLCNLTLKERLQLNRDLLPFIVPKYATINEVEKNDFEQILQEYQLEQSIKLLSIDEIKAILNEHEPKNNY
mgnify:CR=1 FL=1